MVTVGIINYNYSKFLGRAIESALSQGADVIVVDDRSTDDSVAIAKSYKVKLIEHLENSGSAVRGWNDIIEHAGGEYVIFLSSDDVIADGAIEKIEECAATRGGDWIFGDLLVIDENDTPLDTWVYAGWPTETITALGRGIRHLSIPITMLAAFRTQWLRDNGCRSAHFDGLTVASDTATCIRWLSKWPRIRRIPEVLFHYRRHPGQETEALEEQRAKMQQAMVNLYMELFDKATINVLGSII